MKLSGVVCVCVCLCAVCVFCFEKTSPSTSQGLFLSIIAGTNPGHLSGPYKVPKIERTSASTRQIPSPYTIA